MATYATTGAEFDKDSAYAKLFKGTRFTQVRRYGIRIPENGWVRDNMATYLKQTQKLEDMETYLMATYMLLLYASGNANTQAQSIIAYYGDMARNSSAPCDFKLEESERELHQLVRSLLMYFNEMDRKGKRSETETAMENERIIRIFQDAVASVKTKAETTRWKSALLKRKSRRDCGNGEPADSADFR